MKNVNVAVAYVTTQAQLKLYEYLSELGDSVLYCDTESVVFIQNVDDPPKVRTCDYVGLTDELGEFFHYLSLKNSCRVDKKLCVLVFCPSTGERTTTCKVKGIIFNYENSKIVNFTTLRDMILKDTAAVHVLNPKMILRKHGGVVSEPETKQYKGVL